MTEEADLLDRVEVQRLARFVGEQLADDRIARAAEGSGGLIVTGYFTTTVDPGGQVMTSQGNADTVVAGLSTADASHVWSYRFGGIGEEYGFMDNVDPQGAPFVAGVAYGNYDLGQGPQTPGGGPGSDGFIGRYGPTGPTWVKRTVGPGEDKLTDTALGPGQVFAIGWYETSTVVDETTALTAQGGREILLTRWDAFTGQLQLARSFGSPLRDEAGTITRFLQCLKIFRRQAQDHRGRVLDTGEKGDCVYSLYQSVVLAVTAAIDIRAAITELNQGIPADRRIRFRFGMHSGDVAFEGQGIRGDAINTAAHLQTEAEPDQLIVSERVHDELAAHVGFKFEPFRPTQPKNANVAVAYRLVDGA